MGRRCYSYMCGYLEGLANHSLQCYEKSRKKIKLGNGRGNRNRSMARISNKAKLHLIHRRTKILPRSRKKARRTILPLDSIRRLSCNIYNFPFL